MKHPPIPIPGVFSFGTPCLRWKIIEGVRVHNGFPGILPPNRTRYLNLFVEFIQDQRPLGEGFGLLPPLTQLFTIDRFTGVRFPFFGEDENAPFEPWPYGTDAYHDPEYSAITDSSYTRTVVTSSGIIITINVTMSNEYTLGMLEADCDAIIATIDPDTVDWFTLVHSDGGNAAFDDPLLLLPQQYMYGGGVFGPSPQAIPELRAAAWSAFFPGLVGGDDTQSNVFSKAVGYFAMAGNYCEKTFVIGYAGAPISSNCVSGTGSCGNEFKVIPPPLTDGQNAYVLVTPNCICGG